jgi:hypothetical protein
VQVLKDATAKGGEPFEAVRRWLKERLKAVVDEAA